MDTIYRSTDDGLSWHPIANPIGWTDVFAVNGQRIAAIGTKTGGPIQQSLDSLFVSLDNGATWKSAAISFVALKFVDSTILGAGDGVWRSSVNISAVLGEQGSPVPSHLELAQNYPNPFNPTTTITFRLPSSAFVRLRVFDLLGREITTLVSEELSPGVYSSQWTADDLPSGTYLYRLEVGDITATKKLVLIK